MNARNLIGRIARIVALGAVLAGVSASAEPAETNAAPVATTKAVVPEVWTRNFPEALVRAREEHRPLLLRGGKHGCDGCENMRRNLDSPVFRQWVRGTGCYLVEFFTDTVSDSPEQAAAHRFVLESEFRFRREIPLMGVYWPVRSNDEVRVGFSFGRGRMPGPRHESVVAEYLGSLDILLADYLKTCGPRPTMDEILMRTRKKIVAVCEGPGTVTMEPADGLLASGKVLKITVVPAKGYRHVGWKGPNGRMFRNGRMKRISLKYLDEEGTYTAILKKL